MTRRSFVYPADEGAGRKLGGAIAESAEMNEVALVGPTSLALSFIAGGLTFRRQAKRAHLLTMITRPTFIRGWRWRRKAWRSG